MEDVFATHQFTEQQENLSLLLRTEVSALDSILDELPNGRQRSLAKTKLEECLMWANKAIALGDHNG